MQRGKPKGPPSAEHRSNLSKALMGHKGCVGRIRTEHEIQRSREANLGNQHWLGKTHTDETKRKIAATKTKNDPSYGAVHVWMLKYHRKAGRCEYCGKQGKTDWANISGKYRRDRSDFRELCRSCHRLEHNWAK